MYSPLLADEDAPQRLVIYSIVKGGALDDEKRSPSKEDLDPSREGNKQDLVWFREPRIMIFWKIMEERGE